MKIQILFFSILFLFSSSQAFSQSSYEVTAMLPENSQIWPLPEIETDRNIFELKTEHIETKNILSVVQGNWDEIVYLVRYKVLTNDKRYDYNELSFIVKDRWPTKESKIKVKKLHWPFKAGQKAFYLTKDKSCSYKQFFKILSYSRNN